MKLEANAQIPETRFVEASGKALNTIPPSDYSFFEMINANVQGEPADSYNPELAGQLAAIGIVKGKEFKPYDPDEEDFHRRSCGGECCGRECSTGVQMNIPPGPTIPIRCGATCSGKAAPPSKRRRR